MSFDTGSSGEQDHSSGSAAKGITSMGVATHRTCFNCDSEVPSADCCRWGKVAYSCHICKTNYNRQSERVKTDSKLRTWWKNLSREQRIDWRRHCLGGVFPAAIREEGLAIQRLAVPARSSDARGRAHAGAQSAFLQRSPLGPSGAS